VVGCSALTLAVAQSGPAYDPKAEVVLRGKVMAVATVPDWMGKNGVNVTLQTAESTTVHVDTAPAEFLKLLDFAIAPGDDIEVAGVWSEWADTKVFLARTVTKRRVAVLVRDPMGKPVW